MIKMRMIGVIFWLVLATFFIIMNWLWAALDWRNRRKGIAAHVSTVPLLSLVFAALAFINYPKAWIAIIPAIDAGNWILANALLTRVIWPKFRREKN